MEKLSSCQNLCGYRDIWKLTYPIILGSVAQHLITLTDTAFMGRVSVVGLGAVGLAGIFYLVVVLMGLGMGTGAQIIMARRHGEGNFSDIGKVFEQSLYLLAALALGMFLLFQSAVPVLMKEIIKSSEVYEQVMAYLMVRCWGLFFANANMAFRAFLIGTSNTLVITWSTFFMAGINILLNYALIFGRFGFPKMGIAGAALASVIAEASATLFLFVYTGRSGFQKTFALFRFRGLDIKLIVRILRISAPVMLQHFLSIGGWFAFFWLIESMGPRSLAISNMIRAIYIIMMIPVFGFAAATNTLVSATIGKGGPDLVMATIARIIRLTLLVVSITAVLILTFPGTILRLYTSDTALIGRSLPILYVITVAALFFSIGWVLFNGISGTGNTHVSLMIEIVLIIFYLFWAYLMVHRVSAPLHLVWTAEIVYASLVGVTSLAYLKFGRWREKKI